LASVKADYIKTVSGERLRNELRLIFQEPHPERAVWRLEELGVLPHVHPSLGLSTGTKKILPQVASALDLFHRHKIKLEEEKMVWFQTLLLSPSEKETASLCKRLMLSRVEQKIVSQSAKAYPVLLKQLAREELTVSRMYRILCPLTQEVQCFLMAAAPTPLKRKMADYFVKIQKSEPWIRGKDLQAMGIPPGFRYSFILLEALNGQLDGKFKNRSAALQWVKSAFVS
jgi:tRNA nucleotidyltransferase (CCA-adding enzyme)